MSDTAAPATSKTTIVFGGPGCQPKGSLVLMSNGSTKDVSEVKKGCRVISPQHNGEMKKCRVDSVKQYESEIYEVKASDGRGYLCAAEHIVVFHIDENNNTSTNIGGYEVQAGKFACLSERVKAAARLPFLKPSATRSFFDYLPFTVRPLGRKETVYGFSLNSSSGFYITNAGCLTHNTGKSSLILKNIEEHFNEPTGRDFSYITFTKAAATDFKLRLQQRFGLSDDELRGLWIGTQHSLCLRLLGHEKEIVTVKDYAEFCRVMKIDFDEKNQTPGEDLSAGFISENAPIGNKAFLLDQMCRMQMRNFLDSELIQIFAGTFSAKDMLFFKKEWSSWKAQKNKYDFVDLLEKVIDFNLTIPVKKIYLDEAQDLGNLQWNCYKTWRDSNVVESVMICGDDDQAIYGFIGASPKFMLEEPGQRLVLEVNHRNPKEIYDYASKLISLNKFRQPKKITCVSNTKGIIEEIDAFGSGPELLISQFTNGESNFLLARTNYQVSNICAVLDQYLTPYFMIKSMSSPWSLEFRAFLEAVRKVETAKDEKLEPAELHAYMSNVPAKDYVLRGSKQLLLKLWDSISFNELSEVYLKKPNTILLGEYTGGEVRLASITEAAISKLKSSRQKEIAERYLARGCQPIKKVDVFIGTMHSGKGLQAQNIFIVDSCPKKVQSEILGNPENLANEIRVYYVALTRAQRRVVLVFNLFNSCGSFLKR